MIPDVRLIVAVRSATRRECAGLKTRGVIISPNIREIYWRGKNVFKISRTGRFSSLRRAI